MALLREHCVLLLVAGIAGEIEREIWAYSLEKVVVRYYYVRGMKHAEAAPCCG